MSQIHILARAVAERIAAGEVVERPAAVVKELIENAIDAGATSIAVETREGGIGLLRVSDNGSGMTRSDAALAIERFATSKITTEDDLASVRTLGFRGEALPSIASVSQFELLTRAREEIEGTRLRLVDGHATVEVAGAPVGTQVTVRGLFYNAPARRKFLKAPLRETELIFKTVVTYALACPQIAFRLVVDGRESIALPPASHLERLGAVWGRDVAADMLEIHPTGIELKVSGYISRPNLARASREWQCFFVNGRPIRSGLLAVMLERPYAGRIPPGRHPLAVIKIELDPRQVDVNVHPRKAEVRFYQERTIYGALSQVVEEALREFPRIVQPVAAEWPFSNVAEAPGPPPPTAHESRDPYSTGPWRALAQIHNTFLLAASPGGLVIVDQHAAQEQIYYEYLTVRGPSADHESHAEETGRVSSPAVIQLTAQEAGLALAHLDEYRSLGIELEPFGSNTFRVRQLPPFVQLSTGEFLALMLEEHVRHGDLEGDLLRDKLAARAACISAIKAGDALVLAQQQELLDALQKAYAPATCPHGRPVYIQLGLEELERRFLRR